MLVVVSVLHDLHMVHKHFLNTNNLSREDYCTSMHGHNTLHISGVSDHRGQPLASWQSNWQDD